MAQGALLAGLLRAPGYYDPADATRARRRPRWHYVLDGMVSTEHLTERAGGRAAVPEDAKPSAAPASQTTGWKYLLTNAVLADLKAHGISARRGATPRA